MLRRYRPRLTRRSLLLLPLAALPAACGLPSRTANAPTLTVGPTDAALPPSLTALPSAAVTVQLTVPPLQPCAPLTALPVTVDAGGYRGPAELQLCDQAGRPIESLPLTLDAAPQTRELIAGGPAGLLFAVVLIDGARAVALPAAELVPQTVLRSGIQALDDLLPRALGFVAGAQVSYELNGRTVTGYRSPDNPHLWLRDHVYQMQGFAYREPDVTSLLDAFRAAQSADGSLPDVVDDPRYQVTAFRKEVEADVEFLYIQGVFEAWQITGDDDWMAGHLPAMRRAVAYITGDPLRWDAVRGLVRRPYTIDMWDFSYGPTMISPDGKPAPRHWIDDQTIFGIFHGDNTGLVHALRCLARLEARSGDTAAAQRWAQLADDVLARLNALAWNGRFFSHFIADDSARMPQDVDTAAQLSLSNAYALNRDLLERRQALAIIETYYARRDFSRAFAEWYSIDPPFPPGSFGMAGGKGELPGEYVNGGIMPLVGGELANGAFRYGLAGYGFDILLRYAELTRLTGASYLWYYPDGRAGISSQFTLPTDGWGAAAMLAALIEGAGGVQAAQPRLQQVILSPQWFALPDAADVTLVAHHPASGAYCAYRWQRRDRGCSLQLTGSGTGVELRLPLPDDAGEPLSVQLNGSPIDAVIDGGTGRPILVIALETTRARLDVSW
jgi:hypothetical protein